jgi:dihydroneopterin aldolase
LLYVQENVVGQPFVVNVSLHCDLSEAGASDDLQQTVRYGSTAPLLMVESALLVLVSVSARLY